MRKSFLFGMVLASLLMISCSLSVEQEFLSRTDQLPDLQLSNATYTLDRGHEPPLFLKASRIAIYDVDNRAMLTDVSFFQKDEEGLIVLSGKADEAEVQTQTYDATLSGSIRIEKPSEQLVIEAEELMYNHELMILKSSQNSPITLIFEGNKRVVGSDLVAELATATFSFGTLDEGVIVL
ncbi:MAG: hypothetical protein EOM15_06695 [Spirochaetia bacterium]|nr:hypothetical protein [Spirochaetia bacterium]